MMPKNINYKEGQNIEFSIKKLIEFSEKEFFYVLEDANGQKQLLKSEFYGKYNLSIGQKINCKIDHINCAGKIFIEPEHPYYKEGEKYQFIINKLTLSKNRLKESVLQISFIDKIGNEASCKIENKTNNNLKVGDSLTCRVELIKKAKLYLSRINTENTFAFKINNYYNFIIKDIKTLSDSFKYYILLDEMQRTHLLRYEYYENHEFEIGKRIKCLVLKFSSEGYFIIEPKHPFYEINKSYYFDFLKQEKEASNKITNTYNVIVKDVFDKELMFTSNKDLLIKAKLSSKIKCKVIGIKKGKPMLSLI